jgi:aarF domain-containing kinase
MLAASREELAKQVGDDEHGFQRLRHSVVLCLDLYVWEPLCTGLRFLHLVLIFVPVIVTVPIIWCGKRDRKRSNEREGTLWWYSFLVQSMERAGPAFIKV